MVPPNPINRNCRTPENLRSICSGSSYDSYNLFMLRVHPTAPLLAALTRIYPDTLFFNMQNPFPKPEIKITPLREVTTSINLSHTKQKSIKPETSVRISIGHNLIKSIKTGKLIEFLSATNRKTFKLETLSEFPSAILDPRVPRMYQPKTRSPNLKPNQFQVTKTKQKETKEEISKDTKSTTPRRIPSNPSRSPGGTRPPLHARP